jgi:hypothetical protein
MNIILSGKSNKISKKEVRYILDYAANRLMSERLHNNIEVFVTFKDLKTKECGFCWPEDFDERTHRFFCIEVNTTKTRRNQIRTLLHEMVHVKQYAKGELRDDRRSTQLSRWLGELHKDEDYDYWELPWEIEAYGREEGLYRMYTRHKQLEKIRFAGVTK